MDLTKLTAYEVLEQRDVKDLNSEGAILRHKKTGAKITLLSNDDENKVFYIGFRTPPKDSTGVAHIIEHSVLCGSDKYPIKDPFIELAKGSLNTFLNAMTYPDKTVYPVASCNDKDFENLMDVYLDAVFHPNIYKQEKIFKQEGWHYECEDADGDITINGVVYNEMKGAYSSADDLLDREIFNQLYPDTAYGVDSGGKPANIPDLTYRDFIHFHQTYYHPSNSYIYLYGNMDMAERLEYLDKEYLSHYDYLEINSEITKQQTFEKPVNVQKFYPVISENEAENGYYYSMNVSIRDCLDPELYVALQVLDYALCSAPGTPVKMALLQKGIGEDIYSVCENGILQPYFSFVAKNCKKEDEAQFYETVTKTLEEIVANGLDKNAILAAINYYEFKYKEADFGSYPKGLMYGLQALDSWLYDSMKPFMHIEANATFKALKEKAKGNYFEELIQKEILENPHKANVSMIPKMNLEQEESDALKEKLKAFKDSLSKEEIEKVIADTKELKAYQEAEDSKEDLTKIPMLKREDLKKEAEPYIYEVKECAGKTLIYHPIYTNGVSYMRIVFDVRDIREEDLPYLSLFKNVIGLLDTNQHSYGDLFNEMNLKTGGITFGTKTYQNAKDTSKFRFVFEAKAKALTENTQDAIGFIREILSESHLEDTDRLKEILAEMKARMQGSMTGAGHSLAVLETCSQLDASIKIEEMMSGVSYYRFVSDILAYFEEKKDEVVKRLKEIQSFVLRKQRVFYDFTGLEDGMQEFEKQIAEFTDSLNPEDNRQEDLVVAVNDKNMAYTTSAGIQYVCQAGRYDLEKYPFTGALRVLKVMMGYDYLWIQVRVKGGAYGCMSSYGKNGIATFVSYRDPNLEKTFEVYQNIPQYLKNYEADEETLTKYIIGAIADKDVPLTPNAKGARGYIAFMQDQTLEAEQKERDEIINCKLSDINALADRISDVLACEKICVVGNEGKILENKDKFDGVETLI